MTLHVCLLSSHHNSTTQRLLSLQTYIVGMKRKCYSSLFISFVWQRYEKRHKKPSAKPGNRVPRVKVLNYLKKVALFFRFERDISGSYNSTLPSLGVRNWNVVFPSLLVMRKSPKTMTSMPMSTSMSSKSLSITSTLVTKSPVGTSTWTR